MPPRMWREIAADVDSQFYLIYQMSNATGIT